MSKDNFEKEKNYLVEIKIKPFFILAEIMHYVLFFGNTLASTRIFLVKRSFLFLQK